MAGFSIFPAWLPKRTTVEIDPGPTKSGVPIGTMRSRNLARASLKLLCPVSVLANFSTVVDVPRIMCKPVEKSKNPPAIWNAGIEIPKNFRIGSPTKRHDMRAIRVKIPITMAISLRTAFLVPCVTPKKTGIRLNGLRTASIAAKDPSASLINP